MYAYVSHACLVYMEARRGHWVSQNWSSMFVSHRVVQGSNLGPQEEDQYSQPLSHLPSQVPTFEISKNMNIK